MVSLLDMLEKTFVSLERFLVSILPQKFFLTVACTFGVLYALVQPPFQSPDEFNHYYRAWQISTGQLIGIKTVDRLGGILPQGLMTIAKPFHALPFNFEAKITCDTIWQMLDVKLEGPDAKLIFVDFTNTAIYAPTAYFPASIAIIAGRKLDINPLLIFYIARLFTLAFYIAVVYWSIRIIPLQKWLFALLTLLPATLFISGSINADVVTNALSFLCIALFVKWICAEQKQLPNGQIVILLLSLFLITVNKLVYMPLCFLILLVDKKNFKSPQSRRNLSFCFLFLNILLTGLWSVFVDPYWIDYEEYNVHFRNTQQLNDGVNPTKQLSFILHHPFSYCYILCYSVIRTLPNTLMHYLGKFGWEKNYFPLWLNFALLLSLVLQGSFSTFSKRVKLGFWLIGTLISCFVSTVLYLKWSKIGNPFIESLSGKYFVPNYPLFFLAMPFLSKKIEHHRDTILGIALLVWIGSLLYGVFAVWDRYYY